jgi:stage IV sporulation protein FB
MTGSPHFVLLGTPVRVEPTFFLVAAYLGLRETQIAMMVAWVAVMFVGILVHELGHAMAYRWFGSGSAIVLWGFGGLTIGSAGLPPRRRIVVSLAGPLSGLFLLGLPAWWLERAGVVTGPDALRVVEMVFFVSVIWSIVNLLPVLPLDGGNIARDLITLTSSRSGERPARYLSIATAAGAGLYGLLVWHSVFAAIFAVALLVTNVRALKQQAGPAFIRIEQPARTRRGRPGPAAGTNRPPPDAPTAPGPLLLQASEALDRGDTAAALDAVDTVLAQDPFPDVARSAVELRAWALLEDHRTEQAAEALAALPPGRKANRYLRAALATVGTPERDPSALADAFLFGGRGPHRVRATAFVRSCGLGDAVVGALEALGPDGVAEARRLEHETTTDPPGP